MEATLINSLIGAASAVLGAIIAGVATWLAARTKIRHIQIAYEQRLQDSYLENARQYTNSLYVPLSVELAKLARAFTVLQAAPDAGEGGVCSTAAEDFSGSAEEYLSIIDDLSHRGADAFLTVELEEKLGSFNEFLRASLDADEVVVKVVYKVNLGVGLLQYGTEGRGLLTGSQVRRWGSGPLKMSLFGNSLNYRASEVMAAPLGSSTFSDQFTKTVPVIRMLIKEVTLGARKAA